MMQEWRRGCIVLSVMLAMTLGIVTAQNADEDGVIVQEELQRDAAIAGEVPAQTEEGNAAEAVPAEAPAEEVKTEEAPAAEVQLEEAPAPEVQPEEVKAEEAAAAPEEVKPEEVAGETVEKLAEEALTGEGEKNLQRETPAQPAEGEVVAEAPAEEVAAEVPAEEVAPEEVKPEEAPAEEAPAEEVAAEAPAEEVAPEEVKPEEAPAEEAKLGEEPAASEPAAAAEPAAEPKTIDETAEQAVKEAVAEGVAKPPVASVPEGKRESSMDPRTAEITRIKESEILKRKAYEKHAQETTREAESALGNRKYKEAIGLFEEAMKTYRQIPERKGDQVERQRTKRGLADACYRYAVVLLEQRQFDLADEMAKKADATGHPKAQALIEKIQVEKTKPPVADTPKKVPVWEVPEKVETEKKISELITDGLQYMQSGDLDKAQDMFERVMKRDPYNTEAIRLLRKVGQRKLDKATAEREATRKKMVSDVVKTWNPRDYGITEDFEPTKQDKDKATPTLDPKREKILKKMDDIKIPEIDFRQANIQDVVKFLQDASVEYDKSQDEGNAKGVNIILNLMQAGAGAMGAAAPAPAPAEDAFPAAEAPAAEGAGAPIPLVTFSARYISLLEALNIVTKVAGLKYRIESSVVMIVPLDTPEDVLIHRMYDVLPTFIEKVTAVAESGGAGGGAAGGGVGEFRAMDGTAVSTDRGDLKDVFTQLGVPWPKGSQIRHLPAIGKLNVVNTPDNIALFEGILAVLNVVPSQIEIEARFVEIRQTDSDSLGIEWLLNADWNLLQKKGQEHLPLNQRELIRMNANANSGGFTKGNRYVSDANLPQSVTFFDSMVGSVGTGASVADELFTLSGILTDPQLSMVLHALEQKGNADVLSAPKVTTQSGAEATIKVVTEYIYPTEYTVTPITGTTGTSGTSTIMGGIVEPGGFETREVGVILTVVPEVTPDGSMINLTMSPQVVGDPVWHDYGSTYTDGTTTQRMKMEMPFFHTRTITTSISIFNGATVVMGGMITENRNDVEDKIPFLGDIPLLGRLFTSRMEHAEKNNLLIFVTARQVDPAGRVLKRSSGLPGQSTPATPAAK